MYFCNCLFSQIRKAVITKCNNKVFCTQMLNQIKVQNILSLKNAKCFCHEGKCTFNICYINIIMNDGGIS